MKPNRHSILALASVLVVVSNAARAAEIAKLQNTATLNNPASWTGGVLPGSGDVMLWNNAFTAPGALATLSQLGGNLSVLGLKVTDVGGTRNAATTMVGYQNDGSANTLTIGAGGIDLSAATQTLTLASRILLGADQTWSISNANTNGNPAGLNNNEDLTFFSQAAAVPFDFGGRTVTTTGNGQATVTSGYTMSNGTLRVGNNLFVIQGGSNRVTNVSANLNLEVVAGGTLRLQSNSGGGSLSLVSSAPITLNGGTLVLYHNNASFALNQTGPIQLNAGSTINFHHQGNSANIYSGAINVAGDVTWTVTGGGASSNFGNVTGNLSGPANINYLNTATGTAGFTRFSGNNSGYTGTITLAGGSNNRSLRLGSANAGSAAATWNVNAGNILQIDGVAVQLGTLNGAGQLANSHPSSPATVTIGSGIFSGAVLNSSGSTTAVTKVGPGSLSLIGPNNHSGATTVSGGTLLMSSAHIGDGAVSVADGATFGVVILEQDDFFGASSLSLGSSTGSTLIVDLGTQPNPLFAPVDIGDLTVNAPSTLRLAAGNLSTGTFPLIEYDTLAGLGAGGLNLVLPPRTAGSLSPGANVLNVTITAADKIKWKGNVNQTWDIDPNGSNVTGTPNWVTLSGGGATRYIQANNGSDSVLFDDSADSGTVSLSADLSPAALSVDNSSLDYTFTGPGKLTGSTALVKSGTGTLTLANAAPNDFTGGTRVEEGSTLLLGDGVTAGAGQISGNILFDGDLVLNRPDDHDTGFTLDFLSFGTLRKAQDNTVTFPLAVDFPFDVVIDDGTLRFTGGGTFSGILSGSGGLAVDGGTLTLSGNFVDPNTFSGPVSVSAGSLRLSKGDNIQAVSGDITTTGAATVVIVNTEQIADTATLNIRGTAGDPVQAGVKETVANAYVNTATPTAELIARNDFTVTGTVTVVNGLYSTASAHSSTAHAIVIEPASGSNPIVRIAGSGGPSTLNVGSGGITASGGTIQVKFNTNDQDAVLNLGGDLSTTGNLAITNAGYTGANLNVINLTGPRIFDIGAGTTTTVAPDLGGEGSLTKAGQGTLVLGPLCAAAHEGGTVIDAGTLLVNGTHAGEIQVNAAGRLGGSGTISNDVDVDGTVSPGQSAGTLLITSTATLGGGSVYHWEIDNWTGSTAGADWDLLDADALVISAAPSNRAVIRITGTPANFSESGGTFQIARSIEPIVGFNAGAFQIDDSGFIGTGSWAVQQSGGALELVYTAGAGTPFTNWAAANGVPADPALDSDDDGIPNGIEFVLGTNPAPGDPDSNSNDKLPVALKPGDTGYEPAYLTFIFRRSALSASYNPAAEYGDDLAGWTAAVHGEGGVTVSTAPSGDAGVDLVTVKIPRASAAKLFVRLHAEID